MFQLVQYARVSSSDFHRKDIADHGLHLQYTRLSHILPALNFVLHSIPHNRERPQRSERPNKLSTVRELSMHG